MKYRISAVRGNILVVYSNYFKSYKLAIREYKRIRKDIRRYNRGTFELTCINLVTNKIRKHNNIIGI